MPKRLFALTKHPWKLVMAVHVLLYRQSNGAIGGPNTSMPILLLTTAGRKSGKKVTRPQMYLEDGSNYVIAASNAGLDRHPAWFWNLRSNPRVVIQVKDKQKTAQPEIVAHNCTSSCRQDVSSRRIRPRQYSQPPNNSMEPTRPAAGWAYSVVS